MRLGLGMGFGKNIINKFKNRKYTTFDGDSEYIIVDTALFDDNVPIVMTAIIKPVHEATNSYKDIFIIRDKSNDIGLRVYNWGIENNFTAYFWLGSSLAAYNRIYPDKYYFLLGHSYNYNIIDGTCDLEIIIYDYETGSISKATKTGISIVNLSGRKYAKIGSSRSSFYFDGIIDETAYAYGVEYNQVISDETVRKLVGKSPTKCGNPLKILTNVKLYLRLGDKAFWDGNQWHFPDISGNGNEGISQGMDESNVRSY